LPSTTIYLISEFGESAIQTTKKLLAANDNSVLFEAAFENDAFVARADIGQPSVDGNQSEE